MEPQELSPALLQPQVTVVAILGELLATLSSLDKIILPWSPGSFYWDLEFFIRELRATLYRIDDPWWRQDVTSDGDDPPTSLSRAPDAYESNPLAAGLAAAYEGVCSVSALVNRWARLARAATELRNACREVANKAADRAVTATPWARELQAEAARYGTAQENVVELGQALGKEKGAEVVAGHEARVRREARVAAREASRATMERQRAQAALGLLERLVAACDEATAFPRELQRLLRDTEADPKGIKRQSTNVPEDLVAEAERLWEASTRLAKDHLVGAVDDILKLLLTGDLAGPSARGVAKRCQRATEDIPRLLRPLESPQSVPKVSPMSMEPQELSPALLQLPVTVVAILGELLATLPRREEMRLLESPGCLHWDLEDFTKELQYTLYRIDDSWRYHDVTSHDDDPVTSLSQALAAYKSTPGTTWDRVTMAASKWQGSVAVLLDRWAELARKATKLRNTCREVANEADSRWPSPGPGSCRPRLPVTGQVRKTWWSWVTPWAEVRGAKGMAGHEAQVREEAMEATSKATMATMVRQRLEAALGLLERLVAACDKVTAFPRELQRLLWDIKAALEGTNEASPEVPKALVARVAMAERLWEANTRLVTHHLLGAVDDIITFYFTGAPASPSACGVAQQCQRAIEDIPRLLRLPEHHQSVPRVSPVSMEPQELSPPQLQALVAVVATLGTVVATMTGPHRAKSPNSLHEDLKNFTRSLCAILNHGGVTTLGHPAVPSMGQALATLGTTPGTIWANVRATAKAWRKLVARLVDSWDWLAREATKLRDNHRKVVTEQHLEALDMGMAGEMAVHNAQVAAATNEAMAEAGVATRRGHWAVVALGPLQRLVATCDRATLFNWNMECRLRDIEAILKGTNEVSPVVLQALGAKVAKFEGLWDASTCLAKDHLLGTLGDINNLLLSPCGGPGSHAVAERCQKAIEDIPRLLQESLT